MNFELYSRYYDLLYADKDYAVESAYISGLLSERCPEAKAILELGCGTGQHAKYLCAGGYTVHGIERSAEMLKIAEKRDIQGFTYTCAEIERFALDRTFEAAISLFHVISYLVDDEILRNSFKNIALHLNPNALFVFDVWHKDAVLYQRPQERVKQIENNDLEVTRIAKPSMFPAQNRVDITFDITIRENATGAGHMLSELHPMRYFDIEEIASLAGETGFRLLHSEEFLTGKTPGKDTWGVCHILQKA